MKFLTKIAAALTLAGVLTGTASALTVAQFNAEYKISPDCSIIAVSPNATACGGLFEGNNVGSGSASSPGEALTEEYIFNRWGISADGVTTNSPADANGGAAGFQFNLGGTFMGDIVVAIKQGDAFSLYFYDNLGPTTSLTYAGYGGGGTLAADVSHFTVYAAPAIPEPETYALMLAGLGAVGFMARRRRQA